MRISSEALQTTAGALQLISDTTPGERGRRASMVALVLRSVEQIVASPEEAEFVRRRATVEVGRLGSGSERSLLLRLLEMVERGDATSLGDVLNDYAAGLEEARRLPEADAVVTLAREFEPTRPDLALRAGRVARLLGDRERALSLYRAARELDEDDGGIARLAAIGEAVIAAEPESALSIAIRRSIRARDEEAAAVGLEERARVRRARGHRSGAARDFAIAAARFADAVDRGRVAHQLADLFVASDDPRAARAALLFALTTGDRSQQDHARARLHTVSRDLGDQIGMRRWRSFQRPALVSLSGRPTAPIAASAAPAVARWLERVEALAAPSSA